MSKVNCQLSKQSEITVGEKLDLVCTGPIGHLQVDALQIKDSQLSDEVAALTLLEVKQSSSEKIEMVVTTYRTGEHFLGSVVLYDGGAKVEMEGANWTVGSVLSQDPTNPPQPFPKFEMTDLSYPVWFWVVLVIFLTGLVVLPFRQYKRVQKDRRSFDDLNNLETAQSPIDSFYRNLRKLEKALAIQSISPKDFVFQLDKEFRIYSSRTLQFPAHIFETVRTIRYIKSKYPKIYRDYGDDIKKYFSEVTKAKNIDQKDCQFFVTRTQKLIETLQASHSKKRGAR